MPFSMFFLILSILFLFLTKAWEKGLVKFSFLLLTGFSLLLTLTAAVIEEQNRTKLEKIQAEERFAHEKLLALPEGRYILDWIVKSDSTKTRFIVILPGTSKRTVELLAYEWDEWQAEKAILGDTLIFLDVWSNALNDSSKYDRVVQKLDDSHVGWGYVTFEYLVNPKWKEKLDKPKPNYEKTPAI